MPLPAIWWRTQPAGPGRTPQTELSAPTQDALHTRLTSVLLDVRHCLGPVEIVDLTLVARYYERLADHAVAIARAVSYLVTGRHAALAE